MNRDEQRTALNNLIFPETRRVVANYLRVEIDKIPTALLGAEGDFEGDEVFALREGAMVLNPTVFLDYTNQLIGNAPRVATPILGEVGSGYDVALGLAAIIHYVGGVLVSFDEYTEENLKAILVQVGEQFS